MNFDRVAQISFTGIEVNPVTDLRIMFSIEKNDGDQFNSGTITIFNLPETARNKLARPYPIGFPIIEPVITVFLKAGYKGDEVQMFAGQLVSATNVRIGPDWRTDMFVFSGFFKSTMKTIVISLADKTPARTIADRLLAPLKIDVRYTDAAVDRLKSQKVASFSTSSLAYRAAHEFLSRYGLSFTIEEDGQGLVYIKEQPRDPDAGQTAANTYSPTSGMIGTPQITMSGIRIRALLRPRVRLLEKIFVESETISRTLRSGGSLPIAAYTVRGISHTGDTRGEEWYTDLDGYYTALEKGVYIEDAT